MSLHECIVVMLTAVNPSTTGVGREVTYACSLLSIKTGSTGGNPLAELRLALPSLNALVSLRPYSPLHRLLAAPKCSLS